MEDELQEQFHEVLATGDAADSHGIVQEPPIIFEPEANKYGSEVETSTIGGGQDYSATVEQEDVITDETIELSPM